MGCCEDNGTCVHEYLSESIETNPTFLLFGNPNVGKSVIFSKLTGRAVQTANYVGTTVSYTKGEMNLYGDRATLIDVPGIYSLNAVSEAERVAIEFLENTNPSGIIFVLDATNLSQSLELFQEVREKQIPIIPVLNLTDVAQRKGIHIDVQKLSTYLEERVISTVAIQNIGLKRLIGEIRLSIRQPNEVSYKPLCINEIMQDVQTETEGNVTFLDRLGLWSMQSKTGIPIAFLVLALSFAIVIGGGKAVRSVLLLPLVNDVYAPWITKVVSYFLEDGLWHNILVGEYGVFIKGIEWPFALILPYVFFFYIVLSFLEDSGYMPRLGALVDGILRRMGIQGSNVVPFMMGYGCAVPAIIGTRTSTSRKERIIVATVVSVAIPCASQTGAFIALLGDRSIFLLIVMFILSLLFAFSAGILMDRFLIGEQPPTFMEIPHLLIPERKTVVKKIIGRTKSFMIEAELPMLAGILIAAIVVETGFLQGISTFMEPVIVNWLGLPKEATLALLLGFIRRELAVLPLLELPLSITQLFIGSVVALLYLPCLSVFGVLVKEFGVKTGVVISTSTIVLALMIGGVFNHGIRLVQTLF